MKDEVNESSKFETYRLIKNTFAREKYLDCVSNSKHRLSLTRLRCSSQKLLIEEGRFRI